MPRLFISHSSQDNAVALAFRKWLVANGWAETDVFIDLHDLRAGARWRAELRKANTACEAVLLLASPEALDSPECQEELEAARYPRKGDYPGHRPRSHGQRSALIRYRTRKSRSWTCAVRQRSAYRSIQRRATRTKLQRRRAGFDQSPARRSRHFARQLPWTPKDKSQGPYPGLAAFAEEDAGIFFGREPDIAAGLAKLRLMRKRRTSRLLVIQAASGAGKSGICAPGCGFRLKRDADFAPLAILRPAQGLLTGPDGIGRRIAPWFERHRSKKAPGDIEAGLMHGDGAEAMAMLAGLLSEATALSTEARRAGVAGACPPAPLLAVDQGEELFAAEDQAESDRFLELLAAVFNDLPEDVDPTSCSPSAPTASNRCCSAGRRLGSWRPKCRRCRRYRRPPTAISSREAAGSMRSGCAPLSNPRWPGSSPRTPTRGDLCTPAPRLHAGETVREVRRRCNLTLARYEGLGGIGGSIDRALADALRHAGAAGSEENLAR